MKIGCFLVVASVGILVQQAVAEQEYVFQKGVGNYQGTADVTLFGEPETERSKNFWDQEGLRIAGVAWGGDKQTVLIKFDQLVGSKPGQIPPGSMVESATLYLYKTGNYADSGQYGQLPESDRVISIFEMLKPFKIGESDGESGGFACYSYRSFGGDTEEYWGEKNSLENGPVQGVDFQSPAIAQIPLRPDEENVWQQVDLTQLVQQWIDNPENNHGIYLQTRSYWIGAYFASSQFADSALRPKLVVKISK